MKKLFFLAAALMSLTAAAQTGITFTTDDGLTYVTTSDNSVAVKSDGDASEYIIPETVEYDGKTYTVTAIGDRAFQYNKATKIVLPSTIDSIGYQSFANCSFSSITLNEGLKKIGDYAFYSIPVSTIEIPASVESIGSSCFFTGNLSSITLHEGLKEIKSSCFYKCPLEKVVLPESLDSLGEKAFLFCNKLTSVKLPSTLDKIEVGLFYGCEALSSIELPETITSIGDEAFIECSALTSFNIPAAVETLGTRVFAYTGITAFTVSPDNQYFHAANGAIYAKDNSLLYHAAPKSDITDFTVERNCIGISGGAFEGSNVQKVTLPESMLAIDDYAFCQSTLAEINFPSSLIYLGEQAFAGTKLTSVRLPENMPMLLDATFAECANLTSVQIPGSCTYMALRVFYKCTSLNSVTCEGATAPVLEEYYDEWESQFYNCPVSTVTVPKGCTDEYKSKTWHYYLTIQESAKGVIVPESTVPANNGIYTEDYESMSFDIIFPEAINIVEDSPEAFLRVGGVLGGKTIDPDDRWVATKGDNDNTLRVWASDYDGYMQVFKTEPDKVYAFTLPSGVVTNAAGEPNDYIVIQVSRPAPPYEPVSSVPANNGSIESGWVEMKFEFTFDDAISIIDSTPDVKLYVGALDSTDLITPDDCWNAVMGDDDKTVRIWGSDYDGYTCTFKAVDGTSYYFLLPAGVIKNSSDVENTEYVIVVTAGDSGVEDATIETLTIVERYNIQGQRINQPVKGINIIKMSDGSVRKIYVK